MYGDNHSERWDLKVRLLIARLISDIPNLRFFRFSRGKIDSGKLGTIGRRHSRSENARES
jgi:hypothetical protein